MPANDGPVLIDHPQDTHNPRRHMTTDRMTSSSSGSSDEEVKIKVKSELNGTVTESVNEFALKMLKRPKKGILYGQFVLCPLSIAVLLAVLDLGAMGQSAAQLRQLLHVQGHKTSESRKRGKENKKRKLLRKLRSFSSLDALNVEDYHEAFEDILAHFAESQAIKVCTGIFPPKHHKTFISKSYKNAAREMFHADIEKMDFKDDPDDTIADINRWVSERTNGKIEGIIAKGSIDPESSLLLINAVHFMGNWSDKFDPKCTHPKDFTRQDGSVTQVEFMTKKSEFRLAESKLLDTKCLQLDCAAGQFQFFVILPNQTDGLPELEEKLTTENLTDLMDTCIQKTAIVYLPKFQMEQSTMLKDALVELGVKDIFQPGQADLSGIDNRGSLYVSEMMHKAYFRVDENGTEAAAATAVMVKAAGYRAPTPVFDASHPFLFLLREQETGIIAFIGRFCAQT